MTGLMLLAEPWVVIAWYAVGAAAAGWVVHDGYHLNTEVPIALKWAWPIIVFFFSVVGLAMYFITCRPVNLGRLPPGERRRFGRTLIFAAGSARYWSAARRPRTQGEWS